jgi:Putative Ig domain
MTISNGFACAKKDSLRRRQFKSTNPDGGGRSFRHSVALALAFVGLAVLVGCKGGGSTITIQIAPSASPSIDQGQSFAFTATVANDTTNAGVTWSLTQTGCSGSGCGTLTAATAFSVTYTAPTNLSATQSVTLTATANAKSSVTTTATISVNLPPMFTNTSSTQLICVSTCQLQSGGNGQPYNQTVNSTDGVAPLVFSLASGSLPAGLTLNQSGTIVGIPSAPTVGHPPITSTFTLKLNDSSTPPDSVTQQFSITVQPPTQLSITTAGPLPAAFINGQYSTSISATGGVTPYTWSVLPPTGSQTGLPPGIVLSTTSGQITGVPTLQSGAYPKTYTFTVQAQDSSLPSPGQVVTAPISITVQQPPALSITTIALPSGTTATPYSASLQASGGIAPYTWIVTAGQLPAGLALAPNGTISGTPILVTSTPVQFTVQVTDSEVVPQSLTQPLSITINQGTTSSNTLLSGQYAFLFQGFDVNGPVSIAGTLVADGNGNITSGQEDSNRVPPTGQTSGVVIGATLTAGTYSIGNDGRGTLELIFANPPTGVLLRTDYDLVLYSNGNARFIENNTLNTTAPNGDSLGTYGEGALKYVIGTNSSSGATSSVSSGNFSGNYAFEFTGQDLQGKPTVLAGTVNADGTGGNLTAGAGGNSDLNDNGSFSSQSISGNFSVSPNFNRGAVRMTFQVPGKSQLTLTFDCYFVSPTDIYFVEIDSPTTTSATVYYLLSGEMIGQQSGYQFQNTSLIGASVATGTGVNTNTSVLAGLLTATSNVSASLSYDENNGGTLAAPSFAGGYTIGSNGRVAFTWAGTTTPRVAVAYLTGPGQGFLLGYDAAATGGMLEQQAGAPFSLPSFQGSYAIGTATLEDKLVPNLVGQVFALFTPTPGILSLNGTIDEIDPSGAQHTGQALGANVNTLASNGRGTIGTNSPHGFPTNLIFYVVSPSSVRAIPADSNPGNVHPEIILLDH